MCRIRQQLVTPSVGEFTLIRIQLPPTEAARLDALFRSTADRKKRWRNEEWP